MVISNFSNYSPLFFKKSTVHDKRPLETTKIQGRFRTISEYLKHVLAKTNIFWNCIRLSLNRVIATANSTAQESFLIIDVSSLALQ